ncbi:unnamed protein product [Polarella glacialis]|uniref:ELMO domain-containing protein n=1 Tax=Polarella glacialis TaxID=89957 RepID=A0A813GWU9_POLGL|nr:unnamed protein product [Polarella glacialis]
MEIPFGVGSAPTGALYGRPPAQKKKPLPAVGPKTPTTLSDLGRQEGISVPASSGRKKARQNTLTKISEAAEWADESAAASTSLDDEFESLWAEAAQKGSAQPGSSEGNRGAAAAPASTAASTAATALATAAAARKAAGASLGGWPSASSQSKNLLTSQSPSALASRKEDHSTAEAEDSDGEFQVQMDDEEGFGEPSPKPLPSAAKVAAEAASQVAAEAASKVGAVGVAGNWPKQVASDEESSDESADEAVGTVPTPVRTRTSPDSAVAGASASSAGGGVSTTPAGVSSTGGSISNTGSGSTAQPEGAGNKDQTRQRMEVSADITKASVNMEASVNITNSSVDKKLDGPSLRNPAVDSDEELELELLNLDQTAPLDDDVKSSVLLGGFDEAGENGKRPPSATLSPTTANRPDVSKSKTPKTPASWPLLAADFGKEEIWQCSRCRLDNTASSELCAECEAPRSVPAAQGQSATQQLGPTAMTIAAPAAGIGAESVPEPASSKPVSSSQDSVPKKDMMESAVASIEASPGPTSSSKASGAQKLETAVASVEGSPGPASSSKASGAQKLGLLDMMETAVASVEGSPGPASSSKASGAQKLGLLDMMETAVASVTNAEQTAQKQEPSNRQPTQEVPAASHHSEDDHSEDDGIDLDLSESMVFEKKSSSHGPAPSSTTRMPGGSMASLLSRNSSLDASTNVAARNRPKGRIVGRTDVFDEAIKKASFVADSGSSASSKAKAKPDSIAAASTPAMASLATGSQGLSGLRKNYGEGASSKLLQAESRPADFSKAAAEAIAKQRGDAPKCNESTSQLEDSCQKAEDSKEDDSKGPSSSQAPAEDTTDDTDLDKEWADIGERTDELRAKELANAGKFKAQDDIIAQPISYKEVNQWLLQLPIDLEALRPLQEELVEDSRCGCLTRRRSMSDVPGLDKKLCRDKDLVLSLKITEFDFNDTTHYRMLRTIFFKLTRNKVCPTIGRHWEVLGFQAGDPRTDLNRSGGILNVMHMFFFFSHHFELFKAAYHLAQDSEQNFPLACVAINITRMTVGSLLAGRLSSLCNSGDGGVFETTCRVFSGGLFHFYSRWRTQKRTIRDTELTFNEVRELMEKKPARLVEGLAKGAGELRAKSDASRLEFTDLEFGGARRPAAGGGAGSASVTVPARLRNYHNSDAADAD